MDDSRTWLNESTELQWPGHRRGGLRGIRSSGHAADRALAAYVRGAEFFGRHWLFLFNLSLALVLAGALAVAYLRAVGWIWLSEPIATAYLLLCPQRPEHSYFPFGHQMALEQRPVAMFAAQLIGGLAFGLVRRRLPPLDWRLMLLLTLPLAWDGFSQTFGLRDSTWLWRTWTSGLFNLALVWFAYPRFDRWLVANGWPVGQGGVVRERRRVASGPAGGESRYRYGGA